MIIRCLFILLLPLPGRLFFPSHCPHQDGVVRDLQDVGDDQSGRQRTHVQRSQGLLQFGRA